MKLSILFYSFYWGYKNNFLKNYFRLSSNIKLKTFILHIFLFTKINIYNLSILFTFILLISSENKIVTRISSKNSLKYFTTFLWNFPKYNKCEKYQNVTAVPSRFFDYFLIIILGLHNKRNYSVLVIQDYQ